MKPGHVLFTQQFSRTWLDEQLFPLARKMEQLLNGGSGIDTAAELTELRREMSDTRLVSFFAEPSLRTRWSHEAAIDAIGGRLKSSTDNATEFSSLAKRESLAHTARVLSSYYRPHNRHVIVVRHKRNGAALEMARNSDVAIINGGDGTGQHPTQALLDFFTLQREFKRISGLKVAIVGDLRRGRTVRSLAYLLAKYDQVSIFFISPDQLKVGRDIIEYLSKHDVAYEEADDLRTVASLVDAVYMVRTQSERPLEDGTELKIEHPENFVISRDILAMLQDHCIIMHPLPIPEGEGQEIPTFMDDDHHARYFRQAENGLYVRMALLTMAFRGQIPPIPKDLWNS